MDQRPRTSEQDVRYTQAAGRFARAIERLARGYEADAELRRDLVQEIHVALWRSFAYFEGLPEASWRAADAAAAQETRHPRHSSGRERVPVRPPSFQRKLESPFPFKRLREILAFARMTGSASRPPSRPRVRA